MLGTEEVIWSISLWHRPLAEEEEEVEEQKRVNFKQGWNKISQVTTYENE